VRDSSGPLPLLAAHDTQRYLVERQLAPVALAQAMLDPAVVIVALLACTAAFDQSFDAPYMILALIVFSLIFPGSAPRRPKFPGLAGDVLASWLVVVALLFLLGWATRTLGAFDSRVVYAWVLGTPLALIAAHVAFPLVMPRLLEAEGAQRTAVIAGGGELGGRLAERISDTPYLGIRVAGFFDDRGPGRVGGIDPSRILGNLQQLAAYVKAHRVDLIYITLPMASQPRIVKLLDELHDTTASIYFTPDIFLFHLVQARMDAIGGIPVVAVCETPFYGINGIVKRASDILLAFLILILIAPLMVAIAIGVKRSSPGPILFKQRRYGLDGREIVVYKFRTMKVVEDGDVIRQATKDDDRVTRFGAYLRRTSLDELPQFVNVLQGRMSVVGPRPHAVAHNEMYRKLIKGYMIRHKVRPGITGWAQVNGLRGETETLDKMKDRIEFDLEYLRNWSLLLDLQIVVRTVFVVLRKQNAY
jgi:putative colanic acid biosynthesis UDP-glucose lipid carrier transferase